MRIKKGDKVQLIAGKDKGKSGKVLQVFPQLDRVVVEGANIAKRHMKSKQSGAKGQVVEYSSPVHASNVMLLCPKCGKPTRVGVKVTQGEKTSRIRVCKKCDVALE